MMTIDEVIVEFYLFTKIKEINVEIIITDDIYSEKIKYSNVNNRESILKQKAWIESLNGSISEPTNLNDKFIVLINKSYIENCENNEWVGTVCHELTHVWDYIEYAKIKGYKTYEELANDVKFNLFIHWSEFHARYVGHYILRKVLQPGVLKTEMALNDLLRRELPFQINYFVYNYNDSQNNGNQLYYIMQFLGRLKVWIELFPEYFKEDVIKQILGEDNKWLNELFKFLNKYDTLELVKDKLDEIENILKKSSNIS